MEGAAKHSPRVEAAEKLELALKPDKPTPGHMRAMLLEGAKHYEEKFGKGDVPPEQLVDRMMDLDAVVPTPGLGDRVANSTASVADIYASRDDAGGVIDREKDFDWEKDPSIFLQRQPATAMYANSRNCLVLRQERDWNEEQDHFVIISADQRQQFLDSLCDFEGIPSFGGD